MHLHALTRCMVLCTLHRQWIPVNVGQQLTILVGDPIKFDDILEEYRAGGMTRRYVHTCPQACMAVRLSGSRACGCSEMHIKVVTRIGDALRALRVRLPIRSFGRASPRLVTCCALLACAAVFMAG